VVNFDRFSWATASSKTYLSPSSLPRKIPACKGHSLVISISHLYDLLYGFALLCISNLNYSLSICYLKLLFFFSWAIHGILYEVNYKFWGSSSEDLSTLLTKKNKKKIYQLPVLIQRRIVIFGWKDWYVPWICTYLGEVR